MRKYGRKVFRRAGTFLLTVILLGIWVGAPADAMAEDPRLETAETGRVWDGENTDALAAVMRKAERKEEVTIAVIGGSITEGTISRGSRDSAVQGRKPYAEIFFSWWRETFPETAFQFVNAGIGATDSYLGVHRVQRDVLDQEPDLVLVEFSVNDESSMTAKTSYDNLVRRILQDSHRPAVMLLFMSQTNGASAQVPHAAVGKKYALPMVSYKNVIDRLMADGVYTAAELSGDEVHPSALGHRIAGELIRHRLTEVYNERNEAADPVPFDAAPATKEKYLHARVEDRSSLIPDSVGSFQAYNRFSRFPEGWRSEKGEGHFSFTGTFAHLGVLWLRQVNGKCGMAEVWIDGERVATLDGDFPGGWGDYAAAKEVYTSREAAEHRVEIIVTDGNKGDAFTLLGFLVSE